MKHVRKSVLLWYAPQEMYALVTDIERYPAFLPWCDSAELLRHHEDGVTARLGLSFMGVRQRFTTRNHMRPGESVTVRLVDGPFSVLDGTWLFKPVGNASGACRIEFDLRYGFNNAPLQGVVGPVFDKVADTFVDSFVRRAGQVYGDR